ncbi:MAG: efflux RND transporter periplasmic adaptor subunit [bacterium]
MQKKNKKKLFIFLGILLAVVIIIILNSTKGGGYKYTVQTEKVVKGDITSFVSGSAKIQPEVQVKVSARVSAKLIELGVEEGDYVKKGQFLARLKQTDYKAAVNQAESNLKYAEAGYNKARNEYERAKTLFNDNLISKAELDIAKSSYEQAQAQVEQNRAALQRAQDELSETVIYSPMEGTVSKLNKKVGEMVQGSQFTLDVIMIISDLTKMVAETEVDENDIIFVSKDDTAKISVDAYPDTVFKGIVTEIANTGETQGAGTQEEMTNFLVKVAMLEKPAGIRPEMSSTVDILTETHKNTLKLPIQCITVRQPLEPEVDMEKQKNDAEQDTVQNESTSKIKKESRKKEPVEVIFVIKDEVAHQVPVKTGISSDTEWEIVKGVKEGDEVVSGSFEILSKKLNDRDKVKIDNSMKTRY